MAAASFSPIICSRLEESIFATYDWLRLSEMGLSSKGGGIKPMMYMISGVRSRVYLVDRVAGQGGRVTKEGKLYSLT